MNILHNPEEIKEAIADVERAANAAFFAMDYSVLRTIIDTRKNIMLAYEQLDGVEMMYLTNRAFWDIGCYLKAKLARYPVVPTNFFTSISENISNTFNVDTTTFSFSPENLQRCLKLAELVDEKWFEKVARL